MAILEADIKLLASERMTDDSDGGGFMTGTVVADGVENNLFPDISDADRTFGRVQLRKVYAAVTNNGADTFLGAHVVLDETPEDPAASALMAVRMGPASLGEQAILDAANRQERLALTSQLQGSGYQIGYVETWYRGVPISGGYDPGYSVTSVAAHRVANGPYDAADDTIDLGSAGPASATYWNGTEYVTRYTYGRLRPGTVMGLISASVYPDGTVSPAMLDVRVVAEVTKSPVANAWFSPYSTKGSWTSFPDSAGTILGARSIPANYGARVRFSRPLGRALVGGSSPAQPLYDYAIELRQTGPAGNEIPLTFFGQTVTTGALALGDTLLPVVDTWGQLIPVGEGAYPAVAEETLGVDAAPFSATGGRVPIFFANQALLIHHTITVAPQVVSNAQDINLGRTRLAKVRVFGDNGIEITAGFTVNKTTGHIVFDNVAGYSQPVTIQHRIEDMLLISDLTETDISVARGVTHAFPSGSKVSSVLMLGDLQANVHNGWAQATWTNVWSDALIGSAPTADYNDAINPIVVTNAGAITERWAVIFTSSTAFRVVGEQVGQVVTTGSTATETAPVNPATGQPYFSIPAAGWGAGWAAGNVFRFNTDGANAPIWLIRSIAPSDPFVGQDKLTVALRGNVNA